jgi:tellurite resistance protein
MSKDIHVLKRDSEGKLFAFDEQYLRTQEKLSNSSAKDNYIHFLASKQVDTDFKWQLVKIVAAAIASDGVHKKEELLVCQEICNELSLDWDSFQPEIENELSNISAFNLEAITAYLKLAFPDSNIEHSFLLFEAALHIILADGVMTQEECDLLANIGYILNIPTGKMIARIGLFLKEEKQVLVDVTESLQWQNTMYITE